MVLNILSNTYLKQKSVLKALLIIFCVEYVKFMLLHTHMRTCTLNKLVVHQHSHVNHFALPNTFPDLRTSGYGPAK
jgi:hypothetical protein